MFILALDDVNAFYGKCELRRCETANSIFMDIRACGFIGSGMVRGTGIYLNDVNQVTND